MPLRLIQLYLPETEDLSSIKEEIGKFLIHGMWQEKITDNHNLLRILTDSSESSEILDLLEKKYSNTKGFRILLMPVEATIPRVEKPEENNKKSNNIKEKIKFGKGISREELYSDIIESSQTTAFFIVLTVLSAIVASTGILKNNVAVIIGAMVIAPLIGPNVGLSLATTLGDKDLFIQSLKTNFIGFLVALIISMAIGISLHINPEIPELFSRTKVGISDVVLALASGSAGALSFTMGLPTVIIGVMVAVALLPPTVTFGMLLGSGDYNLAFGALILLLVNLICVNLSGVLTFLLQGVRPLTWWESNKAKSATRFAIVTWSILLLALLTIIIKYF